jgi:hypothetical protein
VCCQASNEIIFRGEITKEKAEKFANCADIFMANRNKLNGNDLYIYIDSYGGDAAASDKMVNTIAYMNNRDVKTFCFSGSMIASGASKVFFSCDVRMTKINTKFLIHHGVYTDADIWKRSDAENKFNKLRLDIFNGFMYYRYLKMFHIKLYKSSDINVCRNIIVFECTNYYSEYGKNIGNYGEMIQNEIKRIYDSGIISASYDMLKLGLVDQIFLYD